MFEPGPLHPGAIHLWTADLKAWNKAAGELKTLLSREEISRQARLASQQKAQQSLLCRGILRLILSLYTGQEPASLVLETGAGGKPYLKDSPLYFNIAHSEDRFLCGLDLETAIGVDIQQVYPISSLSTIVKNYFSASEHDYLSALPPEHFQDGFFSIWTAKEAFLKALGNGFQKSPRGFSLLPDLPSRLFMLQDGSSVGSTGETWTILPIEISRGFKAAVALNGIVAEIQRYEFTPESCKVCSSPEKAPFSSAYPAAAGSGSC
jgi:4'-phosphopantetheinyl transferase